MIRTRLLPVLVAAALTATVPALAGTIFLPDASFELDGTLDSIACAGGQLALPESESVIPWSCSGDVTVTRLSACLTPQLPSQGAYAACLSTGALFGGEAVGDVASSLVSPPIDLGLRPGSITVSFDLVFGTDEDSQSVAFNDALTVTLVTAAGPFTLFQTDTWGSSPKSNSTRVRGDIPLGTPNPGCPVLHQTGRISVSASRAIPFLLSDTVKNAPVHLEVQIVDQGDAGRVSFACLDNVVIQASRGHR